MMRTTLVLAAVLFLTVSCGGTVDFTGTYDINLTNGENGCQFADWTVGASTTDIPVTVTQSENNVQAKVEGLVGIFLNFAVGSNTFAGTGRGIALDLALIGDVSTTHESSGDCNFTTNANLEGTLDGDVLSGTIRYTKVTDGHADCAPIEGCETTQSFNGLRPPKE